MTLESIFSTVLEMSLTGSVVIAVVLLARLMLRKAPRVFSYVLWLAVLLRLLCPVSIPSSFSLFHVVDVPAPQLYVPDMPATILTDLPTAPADAPAQPADEPEPVPAELPVRESHGIRFYAAGLWLAGMSLMLLHSAVSYRRCRRDLCPAVHMRDNIYLADHIATPFVLGIFRPKIYLPSSLEQQEYPYILAHEQYHIHRKDYLVKVLAYLALCLHWFNPLVWVAFLLSGKDMEMSCDEAVIRRLGPEIRADYSQSLLHLAVGHRTIAGTPLSFGEVDTKGRVRNMAKWKKPTALVIVGSLLFSVVVVTACAFDPKETDDALILSPDSNKISRWGTVLKINRHNMSRSGATFMLGQMPGSEQQVFTTDEYWLEICRGHQWEPIHPKYTEGMPAKILPVSSEKPMVQELDWQERYGKLSDGTYRLKKIVSDGEDVVSLYAEFQIFPASIPGTDEYQTVEKCYSALDELRERKTLHYSVSSNLQDCREVWWHNGNFLQLWTYPNEIFPETVRGRTEAILSLDGTRYRAIYPNGQDLSEADWQIQSVYPEEYKRMMTVPFETQLFRNTEGSVVFTETFDPQKDRVFSFLTNYNEQSSRYCRVTYGFGEDGDLETLQWDATRWNSDLGIQTVQIHDTSAAQIDRLIESCRRNIP